MVREAAPAGLPSHQSVPAEGFVTRKRFIFGVALGLWVGWLSCLPVHAFDLRSDLSLLGQVRQSDTPDQTQAPVDFYGNLGASGLYGRSSLDTYFRLKQDLLHSDGATDFYAGSLRVPSAIPGVDFTIGRQFLSEGPGGVFVADAGKVHLNPGGPVGFTVFGGQPRYFEPTYSSESLSQDEQIFGGNVHTTRMKGGRFSLGFFEQRRDGQTLRELVTAAGSRAFTRMPGMPNVYGSFAMDTRRQNIDSGTLGFDTFVLNPRVQLNFESSYYKPQNQGEYLISNMNRREDPIFELFSLSEMRQFRGGLRYAVSRTLSAYGDYSYQRYERLDNNVVDGHVGSAGVLWLPGGDGLEVVRVEYYVLDSAGGNVNGGKIYYESRVYHRILFRTKFDVAYYKKETNENDTALTGTLGVGYVVCPGLVWEVDFEANHNKRFSEDYRFGFSIRYNFDYRSKRRTQPQATTATDSSEPTAGRPVS